MRKIIFLFLFFLSIVFTPAAFAQSNSFVSIVNPIRGSDFWELKDQNPETAVLGQIEILKKFNVPATWLIRFDALDNKIVIDELNKRSSDELGLFLEITPTWTTKAGVKYHQSESWHSAGSAFLTGYERSEREKLIDAAFEKFKKTFGVYPVSVGAWWIDSYSLGYMKDKYNIISALIVSDQYSTDNYQIWGQYFSTPYYPTKNNALHPAQTLENKLDIVTVQWAPRDPVNSYGNGVSESTFSVQANDYIDYHDLDIKYFSNLVDIYTKQKFNQFGHLVIGLENSYEWNKYSDEYGKQIKTLLDKRSANQISIVTMKDFAVWYKSVFAKLSPEHIIIADDPLGSFKKVVWFMNPYFRAGWFVNYDGSVFRDIRQYIDGEEELCFRTRCEKVDFATIATRVLDDVSFSRKWVIDIGKITNFRVEKQGEKLVIDYRNEAGNLREIAFLPRDISVDGKILSIDTAILEATKKENVVPPKIEIVRSVLRWSFTSVIMKIGKFAVFIIFAVVLPGLIFTRRFFNKDTSPFFRLFMSMTAGFVILTLLFYLTSLMKIRLLILVYILMSQILFLSFKSPPVILSEARDLFIRLFFHKRRDQRSETWLLNVMLVVIILSGIIFQAVPTFRSGLNFAYGIGFWGPNAHDGVWHVALINQLTKSVPPENPIYSGVILKNYHFFYDLLIATTNYLSGLPVPDLVFRFYPIIFSLMLGIGSYYLAMRLFRDKLGEFRAKVAAAFSLYLIFFAGSFGWIVEFLQEKQFSGESAFWVNQAISFNLNPPFAISLVILVFLLHIFLSNPRGKVFKIITIMMVGTLSSFKSYTGILVLGALCTVTVVRMLRDKDFTYLWITLFSFLVTFFLFLSNFQVSSGLIIFAPFWFIHSMIDSPDRVGWVRLSLARITSQTQGQWSKFVAVETLSLLFFIFGNLGLRFFSFGSLLKIKEVLKNDTLLFIFTLAILSMIIPILFIQSGNPWNTIQFFYPALYVTALFSGLVITILVFKLKKMFAIIFVCFVLFFAPINSLTTAKGYLSKSPHAFVSSKEFEGLQFLASEPDGVVLTFPYDEKLKTEIPEPWPVLVYGSSAYVSAFSRKAVYLEDEPQNQILLTNYKNRLVASKDFFLKPLTESIKFLRDNNIKYIYLQKIFNVRLDENTNIVKNIFENEEVVLYKLNI